MTTTTKKTKKTMTPTLSVTLTDAEIAELESLAKAIVKDGKAAMTVEELTEILITYPPPWFGTWTRVEAASSEARPDTDPIRDAVDALPPTPSVEW